MSPALWASFILASRCIWLAATGPSAASAHAGVQWRCAASSRNAKCGRFCLQETDLAGQSEAFCRQAPLPSISSTFLPVQKDGLPLRLMTAQPQRSPSGSVDSIVGKYCLPDIISPYEKLFPISCRNKSNESYRIFFFLLYHLPSASDLDGEVPRVQEEQACCYMLETPRERSAVPAGAWAAVRAASEGRTSH